MAGMLDKLREKMSERIAQRTQGVDPGPRPALPVEFLDLPPTTGVLAAQCMECAECHTLVLKASTTAHGNDHQRWAQALIGTQYYDGPRMPPPPPGHATSNQPPP